jgi:hypothetical protein
MAHNTYQAPLELMEFGLRQAADTAAVAALRGSGTVALHNEYTVTDARSADL